MKQLALCHGDHRYRPKIISGYISASQHAKHMDTA
jgi:hypothetical protein